MANNSALDDAMLICFTQIRSLSEAILGPLGCEKTLEFNDKLGLPRTFNAIHGWVEKFKPSMA